MATQYANRILSTVTSAGTGTMSLGTAVSPYLGFSVLTSGMTVGYAIDDPTLNQWEVGTGVYTVGTPSTLTRIVESSTASNTAISLSGFAQVEVSLTAAQITALATLASPTFTGTPAAPTAAAGTNTTQIATTAYVETSYASPPAIGTGTPANGTFASIGATAGINCGSTIASGITDLSKQIELYSTTYGIGITSGQINYVVPSAATHQFVVNGSAIVTVTATAMTAPTQLYTDNSTNVATTAFVSPAFNDIGSNILHNGLFRVQQRGTGAWTATGNYTADRWALFLSTSTASVTVATLADADRTAIGDENAEYALQNVCGGTSGAGDFVELVQRTESVQRISGKTVTVSFWAKANTGTPKLGISMTQFFGTGGSPSSTVSGIGATNVTLSTTWTRYSASIAVSSAIGKTFGTTSGTDYTALQLAMSSGSTNNVALGSPGVQSYTLSLWGVQLEVGNLSQLEKPDLRYDLANCQRFYTIGAILAASTGTTSGTLFAQNAYPVTMRASPTVVGTNNSSSNITSPNAVASSAYPTGAVVATGTVTASGVYQLNITYTASADL